METMSELNEKDGAHIHAPVARAHSQEKRAGNTNSIGLKVTFAAVVIAAGVGAYFYLTNGWVSTEDAFVEGHIMPVSPKVEGHVARVLVDDNQQVEAGQILVEIQAADYLTRCDHALAKVQGAIAHEIKARTDLTRYEALAANDEATHQTVDNAQAEADSARADLSAARADLRQAELNLSYTRITAPKAGRVTRKSIEERGFVSPGQVLLAIVPPETWVVANFKETQLRHMKAGQRAEIKVDAYATKLTGHVDSIQSGTGSKFSMFPPENAAGNFVKVVQRVPVKIILDNPGEASRLAPGLSVEAAVETK